MITLCNINSMIGLLVYKTILFIIISLVKCNRRRPGSIIYYTSIMLIAKNVSNLITKTLIHFYCARTNE